MGGSKGRSSLALATAGLALLLAGPGVAADQCVSTGMAPQAKRLSELTVNGQFSRSGEERDISAMACAGPMEGDRANCLLVADDVDFVRRVTIADDKLNLHETVPLFGSLDGMGEADAEGAAFVNHDGRAFYYVTGSHGASRNKSEYQLSRYFVFRLPVDPRSGAVGQAQRTHALERVLLGLGGKFSEAMCGPVGRCRPLDKGGATIEGLAARDGALFFGFRSPLTDDHAYVLAVSADRLFANQPQQGTTWQLSLGAGFGVRDLVAVDGGFLVLAGYNLSEKKDCHPSVVHFWDGVSTNTKALAEIFPSEDGAKPEAMVVLPDDPKEKGYRLLILSDGVSKGAPTIYSVPRP